VRRRVGHAVYIRQGQIAGGDKNTTPEQSCNIHNPPHTLPGSTSVSALMMAARKNDEIRRCSRAGRGARGGLDFMKRGSAYEKARSTGDENLGT